MSLQTERLLLRSWREEDAVSFYEINQDPLVLEFLPGPLSMEQVHTFMERVNKQLVERGYTLWAVELKLTSELMGFIGLNFTTFEAPFTPAIEIGWRLGSQYWGHGFATEGAMAVRDIGFEKCGLEELVSFTVPENQRSRRVMEKIGLKHDPESDFAHPRLEPGHRLSQHVLYRLQKENWKSHSE